MQRLVDRCRFKSMVRSEDGAVSVDFVMWVPILFAIILLATDATLAFMRQSQMWQVSRETARVVSRYGMDELTAEAHAASQVRIGTTLPAVDVAFGPADVTVSMSMPIAEMTMFNTLGFAIGDTITTTVTHAMEPI